MTLEVRGIEQYQIINAPLLLAFYVYDLYLEWSGTKCFAWFMVPLHYSNSFGNIHKKDKLGLIQTGRICNEIISRKPTNATQCPTLQKIAIESLYTLPNK